VGKDREWWDRNSPPPPRRTLPHPRAQTQNLPCQPKELCRSVRNLRFLEYYEATRGVFKAPDTVGNPFQSLYQLLNVLSILALSKLPVLDLGRRWQSQSESGLAGHASNDTIRPIFCRRHYLPKRKPGKILHFLGPGRAACNTCRLVYILPDI
jgi:hypothetical protein